MALFCELISVVYFNDNLITGVSLVIAPCSEVPAHFKFQDLTCIFLLFDVLKSNRFLAGLFEHYQLLITMQIRSRHYYL